MATDLNRYDATALAELIRSKQASSVEVVQAHLDRIQEANPKLNAIVTLADGAALDAAKAADAKLASGAEVGSLHGVPFTVKDSFDTAGVRTQRGSPIFEGRVPDTDATSVARMKDAGAVLMAKTNLPEFAYWIESDNLLTGKTNNPWDFDRSAGGSSGGESASIAAGMSPLGIGSDLSISLRGPAADTGVIGFKPTRGRIPMTGAWPREPRRDWHAGPMARTVREEGIERLQDGFAEFFQQYDVLLLPVTSIFAHAHGLTDYTIDGQTINAFRLMTPTVPFNLTGLPALCMRFGTSDDGMPIAVQIAANSYAESTVLSVAALLESLSPVRDLHPAV
jgi:Asp-tRNA(Asn)/Glu-tRNA(Gln) amidotransferase A subunit family amidase